jgi:predicted MFS family arabinose efflux permease
VAASKKPDRLFGMYFAVSTALGTLLLVFLPPVISTHGYAGGYAVLGVIALVSIPLVIWLPRPPLPDIARRDSVGTVAAQAMAIPALIALALIAASDYGTWTFMERIGANAGLTPQGIGNALAVATLAGSLAAALAAWIGIRLGRLMPITVSFSIMMSVVVALTSSERPESYVLLLIAWASAVFVAYTYVMGTLAAADQSGRLSAIAAGTRSVGGAVGPAAAGLMVASSGYRQLGYMVAVWCALGLVLSLPLAIRLSRQRSIRDRST